MTSPTPCDESGTAAFHRGVPGADGAGELWCEGVRVAQLAERYGTIIRQAHIEVIPNGVDLDLFRPTDKPRPSEMMLHVTNFQPWKGSQLALDVLAHLRATGGDWRLTVLGDGPGAQAFDRRAQSLGMGPAVRRCGPVEVTPQLLGGGSVLLSTSRRESFGLAALEALAWLQEAGLVAS